MYPSPRNPRHDPRWIASSRTASLATIMLNAGLVFGLVLIQTSPTAPLMSQPLTLEIRVPAVPELPAPISVAPPPVSPESRVVVQTPPPPVENPVQPKTPQPEKPIERTKKKPAEPKANPAPPANPRPEQVALPVETAPPPVAESFRAAAPPVKMDQSLPSVLEAKPAESTDLALILAALTALIERHQDYPKAARRAGYEGVVVVAVSVDKNGVITDWSLNQSSAHPMLDKAAEKAIGRLIGERIEGARLQGDLRVLVPIRYELQSGKG